MSPIIELDQLPSPPPVALQILQLVDREDVGIGDLAEVLRTDPVLAARLVRMANSPMYARGVPVTTIDRAVMILGLRAVQLLALSFSLINQVHDDTPIDMDAFWYHSLLNATAARRWAEVLHANAEDEAFFSGLVGQLGRFALASQQPQRYGALLDRLGRWPTSDDERDEFGMSGDDVTVELLAHWGLPALFVAAIEAAQVAMTNDEVAENGMAEALRLARLTDRVLTPGADPAHVARLQRAAEVHGFDADQLDGFVIDLEGEVYQTAHSLDVELAGWPSHADLIDEARRKLVEVSLSAALDLKGMEAVATELREQNAELDALAYRDRLTGIPNRAAFDEHLTRELSARRRRPLGSAVGLLLMDIDHFKAFNDTYGHQIGDEVLRAVAGMLQESTRRDELVARYGGEEFAVVLAVDAEDNIGPAAERFRKAIESLVVPTDVGDLFVTVSVGGAVYSLDAAATDAFDLIRAADRALYRAKEGGRNRCEIARPHGG